VSLPGLTRQSIIFEGFFQSWMDARVKLAHDEMWIASSLPRNDDKKRRVGKAKRAHQAVRKEKWWARRKGAFDNPTEIAP
jgi:hypothetical protein